jgi:hypothetical protein
MEVRGSVVSIDPMFESAPQISLLLYFDRLERFSRIDPRVVGRVEEGDASIRVLADTVHKTY